MLLGEMLTRFGGRREQPRSSVCITTACELGYWAMASYSINVVPRVPVAKTVVRVVPAVARHLRCILGRRDCTATPGGLNHRLRLGIIDDAPKGNEGELLEGMARGVDSAISR